MRSLFLGWFLLISGVCHAADAWRTFTDDTGRTMVGKQVDCVSQFMEDGGANNRDERGHRAWCLNARMGKVGFGSGGGSYSAMWCMDGSGKPTRLSMSP
jgi:hypothetical protein